MREHTQITDEMIETALITWFKDDVSWDKGMAPWSADQFRVEMRATLEAALSASPACVGVGTPPPSTHLLGLSDAQVDAVLHLVESRLCMIWPKIGAREEFANLLRVLEPAPEEEPEICEACGEPLEDGDMVYWSADDTGYLHADCCGPERESYVGPDGAPLKDGEPIPEPFPYRDPRSTPGGSTDE